MILVFNFVCINYPINKIAKYALSINMSMNFLSNLKPHLVAKITLVIT